jgi:Protein of unknown function (DUF559)
LNVAALSAQYPFRDADGRQRYCDFTVVEGDDVRVAIEIDGYDKTGSGQGMSKQEFLDWQRRHASLVALGWDVLRFANADVRDRADRCAEHITLVLRRERSKEAHRQNLQAQLEAAIARAAAVARQVREEPAAYRPTKAAGENAESLRAEIQRISRDLELARSATALSTVDLNRLQTLEALQLRNAFLESETTTMKTTIWAMTIVICAVLVLMFMSLGGRSSNQPELVRMPTERTGPIVDSANSAAAPERSERAFESSSAVAGSSCERPLPWHAAGRHSGQVVSLEGPVTAVTSRTDVQGRPTFIDVGRRFPSRERLALVIWRSDADQFTDIRPSLTEGRAVCVTGRVTEREGVAQVVLNERHQLELR